METLLTFLICTVDGVCLCVRGLGDFFGANQSRRYTFFPIIGYIALGILNLRLICSTLLSCFRTRKPKKEDRFEYALSLILSCWRLVLLTQGQSSGASDQVSFGVKCDFEYIELLFPILQLYRLHEITLITDDKKPYPLKTPSKPCADKKASAAPTKEPSSSSTRPRKKQVIGNI